MRPRSIEPVRHRTEQGTRLSEELQQVIEALARRLHRAVAIDDLRFRLIAYTSHSGEVDPVRTRVILDREASPEIIHWIRQFRLPRAEGAVRIPRNDAIEMLPRVVIPVRHQSVHFGYLWLIDVDESLADEELLIAEAAAVDSGEVLFRERVVAELRRAQVGALVRDLLSHDETVRTLAATTLVETGAFAPRDAVVALVLRPLAKAGQQVVEDHRLAAAAILDHFASKAPPRECLTLVRPDHAVLLTTDAALRRRRRMPEDLQASTARQFRSDDRLLGVVVGIGAGIPSLADALTSYRQASHAAKVAEVMPLLRPVARYTELGVYALLLRMGADELAEDALPEQVRRLLHQEPGLLRTAEVYLDRAGDSRLVASELAIHRATVYQRLRRIEQVAMIDFADGEQRLAMHLGIKLARLLRLWWAT